MNLLIVGFFLAFIFVFIGLIVISVGLRFLGASDTQQRIQSYIQGSDGSAGLRNLTDPESAEFSESFMQRTVFSWLNTVISFLGRFTPDQTIQETQRRLTIAGHPLNLRAPQFYGFRMLFLILGVLVSFAFFQLNPSLKYLFIGLGLLLVFILGPDVWLTSMMRRRQDLIRKGLPDTLDMLSVCVSAGLSFDQAILRVGQTYKTAIGMELARVVSEIEVGVSRRQALRNLQARVDITELSSFVAVILQSESLGMSIANVLSTQAEQMRIYRQYRAKAAAQQLPAKMMVPLALFIFPALWAVILGPNIPNLTNMLK